MRAPKGNVAQLRRGKFKKILPVKETALVFRVNGGMVLPFGNSKYTKKTRSETGDNDMFIWYVGASGTHRWSL